MPDINIKLKISQIKEYTLVKLSNVYGVFVKKNNQSDKAKEKSYMLEIIQSILFGCILTFGFRSFIFDPYRIPTSSMEPNLVPGDRIVISKYRYGYSGASLFPITLTSKKRFLQLRYPKRGEVVVFLKKIKNSTTNSQSKIFFVKRIVAIGGDTVKFLPGNKIAVNGKVFDACKFKELNGSLFSYETSTDGISYIKEEDAFLPESQYFLYKGNEVFSKIKVPEGHYFVMGDNRSNSADSRFLDYIGFVHNSEIAGRVESILFSSTSPGIISGLNPFNLRLKRSISSMKYKNINPCKITK